MTSAGQLIPFLIYLGTLPALPWPLSPPVWRITCGIGALSARVLKGSRPT